ncbi:MAG: helix-turn-helix transcriptional regulator [Deltaproteobacteria bacterium]|nr:helix-turn-helix transcriptional regulator [Deltaproteobacteria bacterium]MBW1919910.1 helix-turn-helix transcriptional regulator [Deltaproteobacteria bacterium]MBW1936290.1 helix-turn-helix transcriptional regulator [Deltaproteobacteria bacterium]MBW2045924.1 helix-turn-helix transcriptional regulator [Deltaproteobacteria bacterium]MBW2300276.1 helix-turn-helix transcriptional regulator [Deltaproteobacteria bacterium]
MNKTEFSRIRNHLGKTQKQMAQLLGTSLKAIQSFEQGWRKIPVHIERQVLFLLLNSNSQTGKKIRCWSLQNCPIQTRRNCPAWEFQLGNLCWFINGTICHGKVQENWEKKMKMCRKCDVFKSLLPSL